MKKNSQEIVIKNIWDKSLHCFGTSYIFEKRSKSYSFRLKIIKFFSILLPLIIGYLFLNDPNLVNKYSVYIIKISFVIGLIQIVVTVWSIIDNWDDRLGYSLESTNDNLFLSEQYKSIATILPLNYNVKLEILDNQNQNRTNQDLKQGIKEKEKRMAMRYALRQYQRECATCNIIPKDMKPSECDTCGNF